MNDLERLKAVLSADEIRQLVDMVTMAHERAVARRYKQSAHVYFNEHGHVTEFGATDNVRVYSRYKVAPLE
jgi:hypothetical protein